MKSRVFPSSIHRGWDKVQMMTPGAETLGKGAGRGGGSRKRVEGLLELIKLHPERLPAASWVRTVVNTPDVALGLGKSNWSWLVALSQGQ